MSRLLVPPVRQELLQLGHRRGHDAGQHVGKVTLRIQAMGLGVGDLPSMSWR